jgi:beta-glucosidase-like glycosyl hydrolase
MPNPSFPSTLPTRTTTTTPFHSSRSYFHSHSCGSAQLLTEDLKETLAFKGFVMSDW